MIKIAFFDIDGTLVDMHTKTISNTMIDTLLELKKKDIKICIATGRPPRSVPQFPRVEFDAYLTFNGSYCIANEDVIFKNPIPCEDVQRIIKNTENMKRPIAIANIERTGANGKDQDLVDYYAISKQTVIVIDDFADLAKEDIYQMMVGYREHERETLLKGVNGAKITAWWSRAADIIPANGGKGLGVEKVLSYFHMTKEEAIAFGDGSNDIEMLQAVGCGVAMGNATADVKAIADEICGRVDEEGIYHFCKEHKLID